MASTTAAPAPMARLSSTVELFLSAKGLVNRDSMSKSDPYATLSLQSTQPGPRGEPPSMRWVEVARTETIMDSLSPSWVKQLKIEYHFEEMQNMKLSVWDYDDASPPDFLGECTMTLGRLMGARGQQLTLPLTGVPGAERSMLTVRGAEVRGGADELQLSLRCSGLTRMNFFGMGGSDPFFVISRVLPDGGRMQVWKSTVVKGNLNPAWPAVSMPVQLLCNGDLAAPLALEVFDWESSGSHKLIGGMATSTNGLLQLATLRAASNLTHSGKPGIRGMFYVDSAKVVSHPTLLDYVAGGAQIGLMVGVDYTGSNGDPRTPTSLHSCADLNRNEYLQALRAVGSILLEYCGSQHANVPFFGFGGAVNGQTRHIFPVNFNETAPYVEGVQGLEGAYVNSLSYVQLSGPTLFEPLLLQATAQAQANAQVLPSQIAYTVLLLLTDGQCNDMDQTIRAIVNASTLPLSIVIVGVGGADFSAMELLDGDGQVLSSNGRRAARDIVQFVPFRKFAAMGARAGSSLASETLAEIPAQFLAHYRALGIPPPERRAAV